MDEIKFYHKEWPERTYYLRGSRVFLSADGQEGNSIYYIAADIEHNFQTGIWVKVEDEKEQEEVKKSEAIISDGRSSTYYDLELPSWLVARILDRHADGRAYIKTEELITTTFSSDFDLGNAFKSLVRLWGTFNGAGKAGNSLDYEKNKIEYSLDKLKQRFERKEEV
ncbi:hypothetical protein D3C78_899590 [compost metagenome]